MLQGGYPMSAKNPIGSNLKLFRAKKKLLKDFITNDPYLSGELGNYKHGTLFRHDIVFVSITDGSRTADLSPEKARVFVGFQLGYEQCRKVRFG